jgi:thioredoxin 1
MSAICLCGVCVPYSAILPLILVLLQYIARPLAKMGLLPAPIAKKLGITTTNSACTKQSCCDEKPEHRADRSISTEISNSTDEIMYEVADTTQFQNLLSNNELVFVKFTAEWCKPCKEIQPFFHEIGAKYANTGDKKIAFTTVDVDELDEIASKYNVAMMPTFVAIRNGVDVFDTMSGSNEGRLETFVKNAVES